MLRVEWECEVVFSVLSFQSQFVVWVCVFCRFFFNSLNHRVLLQNILGCYVWKMYANLQLWVWIPLVSAVAQSELGVALHACRRNLLHHPVFSSDSPQARVEHPASLSIWFRVLTVQAGIHFLASVTFWIMPCVQPHQTKGDPTSQACSSLPSFAHMLTITSWTGREVSPAVWPCWRASLPVQIQLQTQWKRILNPVFDKNAESAPNCSLCTADWKSQVLGMLCFCVNANKTDARFSFAFCIW